MGELAQPLISFEITMGSRKRVMPSAISPLVTEAIETNSPGILKAGKVTVPFAGCSTCESGPCTLPGQYS